MAEFKVPQNAGDRYPNQRASENYGKRRGLRSADTGAFVGKSDARHRISARIRSRNNSCGSTEESSEQYRRNERYQVDGYVGSLRSPLRASSQLEGRNGRWRDAGCKDANAYRTRRTNLVRDRSQHDSFRGGKSRFPDRGNNFHHKKYDTTGRNASKHHPKSCASSQSWRSDSVEDFPPLGDVKDMDWGSRVEIEELQEELMHAENSSQLSERSEASGSRESLNQSLTDKKTNFTPKRRFSEAELNTPDIQAMMARRQKQIDYGKNTPCYESYLQAVPRNQRSRFHPSTPDKNINYSRRGWDMIVKIWRKKLHAWDPAGDAKQQMEDDENSSQPDDSYVVLDETLDDVNDESCSAAAAEEKIK